MVQVAAGARDCPQLVPSMLKLCGDGPLSVGCNIERFSGILPLLVMAMLP